MKRIIITLALFVSMATYIQAGIHDKPKEPDAGPGKKSVERKWNHAGSTEKGDEWYVDMNSITGRGKEKAKSWIRAQYKQPITVDGKKVVAATSYIEWDCRKNRYRIIKGDYELQNGKRNPMLGTPEKDWTKIVPKSMFYVLYAAIC